MKKIIFAIDRYFPTDHSFIEEVYTKILPKKGYDVTIIARSRNIKGIKRTTWNSAKLILIESKFKYLSEIINYRKIRNLLDKEGIIQIRNDPIFALLSPRLFFFQQSHLKAEELIREWNLSPTNIFKGIFDLFLRRRIYSETKGIFAISEEMKKYIEKKYNYKNVIAVPLGVAKSEKKKRKEKKYSKKTLIYIGTLSKIRRLDIVLKAFKIINTNNKYQLLFLGNAKKSHVQALKNIVTDEKIEGVKFLGHVPREEVAYYIRRSHIGLSVIPVNNVYYYSSPTKALEYLNEGVPVLATNIPDQTNIINKSKSGLICKFEADDIAKKIKMLLESKKLGEMGKRGQKYVQKNRNYEVIADKIIEFYKKCAK